MNDAGALLPSRAASAARHRLALAVIFAALVVAVAFSWIVLSTSRQSAAAATSDLSACRSAAAQESNRCARPAVAGSREVKDTELSRRLEESARSAGMSDRGLDEIEPEPSRRAGDSPYRLTPTRVRLRNVTLGQLFAFFHAVAADDANGPGLRLEAVRLSAPRGEETGDRWTAEATLCYLVYDPVAAPSTMNNVPAGGAIAGK